MAIEGKQFAMDCNNFSLKFNERALDAYLLEKHSDCTFLIEEALEHEKKLFKCNKLMLSLASPIFEDLLSVSFTKLAKGPDDEIIIKGVSSQCFDIALRFIYGKKLETISNLGQAKELAYFAHQWQIKDLAGVAVDQFNLFEISGGQHFELYLLCKLIGDQVKTGEYFQQFFCKSLAFLDYTEWLDAEKLTMLGIVSTEQKRFHDLCNVEYLFFGLLAWGEHRVKLKGEEESDEATREELTDFLPLIRFRLFSTDEFDRLCDLECCNILSDSERVAIRNCLMSGEASDMPPGFNTDKRQQRG